MFINKKPLVSIISPCYNGEKWVGRMLDSILTQTHSNIEMICVNDGSTDSTATVIKSNINKFADIGMTLQLISQKNLGQAAAMNAGFKASSGKYLSWIDCDDFLTPNSIEKKLNVLKNTPDVGVVTANYNLVDDGETDMVIKNRGSELGGLNYQREQFYLTIAGLSIIESGCHLVRASCFDSMFPQREIHPCREGQNYQMLLPIYYHFHRMYIDEPLSYYVIRENSHYHKKRTREEWRMRYANLTEMLESILYTLKISERESHRLIKQSYFYKELRRYS